MIVPKFASQEGNYLSPRNAAGGFRAGELANFRLHSAQDRKVERVAGYGGYC